MRSLLALGVPWKALLVVTLALSTGVAHAARPTSARKASTKKAGAKSSAAKSSAAKSSAAKSSAAKSSAAKSSAAKSAAEQPAAAAPPAAEPPAAAEAAPARPVEAKPSAAKPAVAEAAPEPPAAEKPMLARKTAVSAARPVSAAPAIGRPAPTKPASAPPEVAKMRIGVGIDLFTENSQMTGEQAINSSRLDESFDYGSSSFLSATLSLSVPAPIASERARIGGGVRLFGNYGGSGEGEQVFGFGLLNQAFLTGEYGLPVAERMEAMFGIRGGVSLLIPGRELSAEIRRLRDQGVDVWNVPRVGWLLGLNLGARRQMSERILLRADLVAQAEKLFLFDTSQDIDGLEFSKDWSSFGMRLGLTLGIEFAL